MPAKSCKEGLKIYPLTQAGNPSAMEFISVLGNSFNTIHANNFDFYTEIAEVIAREPVDFLDPELRGTGRGDWYSQGPAILPGSEDESDPGRCGRCRQRHRTGVGFPDPRPRDPEAYFYENSAWKAAFIGADYQWLLDGGIGGRNLDARSMFFYLATVNTPAMAMKMVGLGSQYAYANHDSSGDVLDGSKQYRLRIPADVPAKDFWWIVVYDPQTRSELQTSQRYPSKNNLRDPLQVNADGSVDLYFGPTSPDGQVSNWTETVPGKGWFTIFRLYGPLDPWFDKTWRPGEVEPLS